MDSNNCQVIKSETLLDDNLKIITSDIERCCQMVKGYSSTLTRCQLRYLILKHRDSLLSLADLHTGNGLKFSRLEESDPSKSDMVTALILIDAILKPSERFEVIGGFQQARLSYISPLDMPAYYRCLDTARESSVQPMEVVAKALVEYFKW